MTTLHRNYAHDLLNVNDTYGHQAGDNLLVSIAERLKDCVRESDTIARIGGDEFILILKNATKSADIKVTAQKILTSLTQPFDIAGRSIQISASIGIVIIPVDGIDPDELMRKADMALYHVKNQGRNTFQFYSELD